MCMCILLLRILYVYVYVYITTYIICICIILLGTKLEDSVLIQNINDMVAEQGNSLLKPKKKIITYATMKKACFLINVLLYLKNLVVIDQLNEV